MTEEKPYLIGNKEFVLREDLSISEIEIVEEFQGSWKATKNTISSKKNYSLADLVNVTKTVLTPIDGSNKDEFDWKVLQPQKCIEIIADFVKKKAMENMLLENASQNYKSALAQQTNTTKN